MFIKRMDISKFSRGQEVWMKDSLELGYNYFQNEDGSFAWQENFAYAVDKEALAHIRETSERLHKKCIKIVEMAISNPKVLSDFHIPHDMHQYIIQDWKRDYGRFLIGRFDFAWTPTGVKMIEYNADTPATIPESTRVLAKWGESVGVKLAGYTEDGRLTMDALATGLAKCLDGRIEKGNICHVMPYPDNVEDKTHAIYWGDALNMAGYKNVISELKDFNINYQSGKFMHHGLHVDACVRMYPWEFMLREPGRVNLYKNKCLFLNPAWTTLLSNKALLAILYGLYPDDPAILPAFFYKPENMSQYAVKPIHSRGGENIILVDENGVEENSGSYNEYPVIYQERTNTRAIDENVSTSIGAWMVGNKFSGLTFREDKTNIVKNNSSVVPHYVF